MFVLLPHLGGITCPLHAAHDGLHARSGLPHILVLPDPNDEPSALSQRRVGPSVPRHVRLELRLPISPVRARVESVFRASVPEAPIDKDGHSRPCEDKVRSREHVPGPDRDVDPVAQSPAVQLTPQPKFGGRVSTAISQHRAAGSWAGRVRVRRRRHGANQTMPGGWLRRGPRCAHRNIRETLRDHVAIDSAALTVTSGDAASAAGVRIVDYRA